MTGIDVVHVQYRGNAPALTDLLAGQVQLGFDTMPASIEYISWQAARSGRIDARTFAGAAGPPERERICSGL
jgi:tripartite-type tricarboxylate transporter receptor subunit TctC